MPEGLLLDDKLSSQMETLVNLIKLNKIGEGMKSREFCAQIMAS
jgi:hypothetical protein